ncbi:hypothetical protein WOLCODRAFT_117143 [Wolfiporia cocos MD-104 SS10]|uniref:Probable RNA polymerase II nuclear localization protein SLC7A6OS n=1 Tax=Wolfiporia cocos (strain MD-104) TaxID=742152 RepID=A0A2H3JUH0_WOLCO|nr:hypothetical protein WOLCODRAFT_117143 [Wolfiporia cocos MD-104 SS10]
MQPDPEAQSQSERPYAILRIKRKRNEEPLDGLLVDPDARPSRKRSRGALNFFKFVETVEEAAWVDAKKTQDLQDRLAALAREPEKKDVPATSVSAPAIVEQPSSPVSTPSTPLPLQDDRKYTIIKREVPSTDPRPQRRNPTAPPKIWSTKELEALRASRSKFTMYDAVLSTSNLSSSASKIPEIDPEVAKFLPLLKDLGLAEDGATSSSSLVSVPAADDNDYVYDVFYQRPTTFQELYEPSTSIYNIGTLTNIPEELMLYDTDSESEVGDTDDEDSNAEDWYTNEYPDEESSEELSEGGSDEYHEDSDHELQYDDDSDHEWR